MVGKTASLIQSCPSNREGHDYIEGEIENDGMAYYLECSAKHY
jgi:hypothetical protein